MKLTAVPSGSFTRLLSNGDEQRVQIDGLRVGTFPVTVAEYETFLRDVGWAPSSTPKMWDGDWKPGPLFSEVNGHGIHKPVVGVSYSDAQEFIEWLRIEESAAYRLPTEAEFHYFSLGGQVEADGCGHAVRALESRELKTPRPSRPQHCPWDVGSGVANEYGLHDTHGLIWQWCSDWYADYGSDEASNPTGPKHQPDHTIWEGVPHPHGRSIRGGSFSYSSTYAECSRRHYTYPTDRTFTLGFRVVADG